MGGERVLFDSLSLDESQMLKVRLWRALRRDLCITVIPAPESAHEVRPFHSWGRGIPLALSRVEGSQERNGWGLLGPNPDLRKGPTMGGRYAEA